MKNKRSTKEHFLLEAIPEDEECEFASYEELKEAEKVSKAEFAATKAKTATLIAKYEKDVMEMGALLGKLKTGTATRRDKDRMASKHKKLSARKKDIEATSHRKSDAEMRMLEATMKRKTFEVREAMKEKEVRSVVRAVRAAESVDLAFVIDGTGSMKKHITAVKQNIRKVVKQIMRTNGNLNLRLAVVIYRDLDDIERYEVLDFVTSIEDFEVFVGKIQASGGGDSAEDMAGGIKKANGLSWRHATRVAFLIADCPCHGTEFHRLGADGDNYPNGTPGIDIKKELKALLSKKDNGTMTLYFGRITRHTDAMLERFDKSGIPIEVVDLNNTKKMAHAVTQSVRKSISTTITATCGGTKSFSFSPVHDVDELLKGKSSLPTGVKTKRYRIVPGIPTTKEWKKQTPVSVNIYRNVPIKSLSDLQIPIRNEVLRFPHALRRAAPPFAEGGIRIAYHAQLASKVEDLHRESSRRVVKSFMHHGKGVNDRHQYLKQMEVSNIAHFLARVYNKSVYRPDHCAPVHYLQVCVVEEQDEENEHIGNRRYCAESLLPQGKSAFKKYSDNKGNWFELSETLLRFTEFTYMVTDGYLMVTDLQGVRRGSEFFLTDPAILCRELQRFGNTNMGEHFMSRCLKSARAHMKENGWK